MNVDVAIINFVQEHFHNAITDAVFPVITLMGELGILWITIGLALTISKTYRRKGVLMLISLALAFVLGELVIKPIVARPRPFMDFPGVPLLMAAPTGFSCPSSHAASSFASALSLWYCNKKMGAAALVLAALIAFSRVFLFFHYPSDVVLGTLLGIVCAFLVHQIEKHLRKRKSTKCV